MKLVKNTPPCLTALSHVLRSVRRASKTVNLCVANMCTLSLSTIIVNAPLNSLLTTDLISQLQNLHSFLIVNSDQ